MGRICCTVAASRLAATTAILDGTILTLGGVDVAGSDAEENGDEEDSWRAGSRPALAVTPLVRERRCIGANWLYELGALLR